MARTSFPRVRAAPRGSARGAAPVRGTALPRQLRPSGDGCMEGSTFLSVDRTRSPGTEHEAPRGASRQGGCKPSRRAAESHGALLRKSLHGTAFAAAPDVDRNGIRKGAGSQVTAGTEIAVAPVGLVPTVVWCLAFLSYGVGGPPRSMRWCQRRLRPGRLGPGSGRSLRRCAPSSEGGRDLLCADPLRSVGSATRVADEAARGSIAVPDRPTRAALRGSWRRTE